MWEHSPRNRQKLEFCPQICPSGVTRSQTFYEILSICTRPYRSLCFSLVAFGDTQPSYKHFPSLGTFSHQFSIAPDRIETAKMGRTSCITMLNLVGIVRRTPAVDKKSNGFCLFVFCHAFELRSV